MFHVILNYYFYIEPEHLLIFVIYLLHVHFQSGIQDTSLCESVT